MSLLQAQVAAGEAGPLIRLSGETDMTTSAQLSRLIAGQLAAGTPYLTVDLSELEFADTASIRVLIRAGLTLQRRGGDLLLLRPWRTLAKVLELMGADRFVAIRP